MMARWFRSHAAKINDPKVHRLTDRQYRAWDLFLCMAAEFDGRLPLIPDAAFLLRKSEEETGALIRELIDLGFLVRGRRGIEPHNWNKWQYKSDVSTNRVKEFRERQRNVSVTPSESESEADTEQTKAKALEGAQARRQPKPTRLPDDWKPDEAARAYASDRGLDPDLVAEAFVDYWTGGKGAKQQRVDWNRTWRVWCDREPPRKSIANGAKTFDQQRQEAAAGVLNRDDVSQWTARLRAYRPGGFWLPHEWGPPPESGKSRVPQPVLADWQRSLT